MEYNSTSCALSDDDVSISDLTKSDWLDLTKSDNNLLDHDDSEINFSERLKFCFKPKYQPRNFQKKGAIFVLVWNFLVTTVFYYMEYKSLKRKKERERAITTGMPSSLVKT